MGTDELVVPRVYHIGNSAKPVNPVELYQQKRINSLYGQAEFSYADYVFVTVGSGAAVTTAPLSRMLTSRFASTSLSTAAQSVG